MGRVGTGGSFAVFISEMIPSYPKYQCIWPLHWSLVFTSFQPLLSASGPQLLTSMPVAWLLAYFHLTSCRFISYGLEDAHTFHSNGGVRFHKLCSHSDHGDQHSYCIRRSWIIYGESCHLSIFSRFRHSDQIAHLFWPSGYLISTRGSHTLRKYLTWRSTYS